MGYYIVKVGEGNSEMWDGAYSCPNPEDAVSRSMFKPDDWSYVVVYPVMVDEHGDMEVHTDEGMDI